MTWTAPKCPRCDRVISGWEHERAPTASNCTACLGILGCQKGRKNPVGVPMRNRRAGYPIDKRVGGK